MVYVVLSLSSKLSSILKREKQTIQNSITARLNTSIPSDQEKTCLFLLMPTSGTKSGKKYKSTTNTRYSTELT